MRDYQRSKLYDWENTYIHKDDKTLLTIDEAQDFVDFIWYNMGRDCPPKVSINKRYKTRSTGSRLHLEMMECMLTRTILVHEVAHALMRAFDEYYSGHGPEYVGTYINLLSRFLGFNIHTMFYTLTERGVKFDLGRALKNL